MLTRNLQIGFATFVDGLRMKNEDGEIAEYGWVELLLSGVPMYDVARLSKAS